MAHEVFLKFFVYLWLGLSLAWMMLKAVLQDGVQKNYHRTWKDA